MFSKKQHASVGTNGVTCDPPCPFLAQRAHSVRDTLRRTDTRSGRCHLVLLSILARCTYPFQFLWCLPSHARPCLDSTRRTVASHPYQSQLQSCRPTPCRSGVELAMGTDGCDMLAGVVVMHAPESTLLRAAVVRGRDDCRRNRRLFVYNPLEHMPGTGNSPPMLTSSKRTWRLAKDRMIYAMTSCKAVAHGTAPHASLTCSQTKHPRRTQAMKGNVVGTDSSPSAKDAQDSPRWPCGDPQLTRVKRSYNEPMAFMVGGCPMDITATARKWRETLDGVMGKSQGDGPCFSPQYGHGRVRDTVAQSWQSHGIAMGGYKVDSGLWFRVADRQQLLALNSVGAAIQGWDPTVRSQLRTFGATGLFGFHAAMNVVACELIFFWFCPRPRRERWRSWIMCLLCRRRPVSSSRCCRGGAGSGCCFSRQVRLQSCTPPSRRTPSKMWDECRPMRR